MKIILFLMCGWWCLAQADVVDQINLKLNATKTLKAHVVQRAQDGSVQRGVLYLKRPGKLKMKLGGEYPFFLITDGTSCVYQDAVTERPFHVPFDRLPLGFLLKSEVNLKEDFFLKNVRTDRKNVWIDIETKDHLFQVSLWFDDQKQLKGWITHDPEGNVIQVYLKQIQINRSLDDALFAYQKKPWWKKTN